MSPTHEKKNKNNTRNRDGQRAVRTAAPAAGDQVNSKPSGSVASDIPNQNKITTRTLNAGIAEVQTRMKLNEVQNLEGNNTVNSNQQNEWQEVTRRAKHKRRFVVGDNTDSMNVIQAVPKRVALHVTRLQPNVNLKDFERLMQTKFPEAKCEHHESRLPNVYSSVKVTIKQSSLKDAWRKEVWPEGALVSFFRNRKKSTAVP